MEALFLLIAISLLVALGFLGAFLWAVRSNQYDDDFTPSVRMLFDNETKKDTSNPESSAKQSSK
ncbi:MAG: cbb3-type cytochrome oxidase assembly protein CcoS [Flavobacteriales bacterium]|nr:cbb3-type cytochrome oxidase assembly protein CcoS [Flavobacteriales bacterium]